MRGLEGVCVCVCVCLGEVVCAGNLKELGEAFRGESFHVRNPLCKQVNIVESYWHLERKEILLKLKQVCF